MLEVRAIVADVLKEAKRKKAYKGAAIGLLVALLLALVAIFGVSFAAGEALKLAETLCGLLERQVSAAARPPRRTAEAAPTRVII